MKKKILLLYEIFLVILAFFSVIFVWSSNQRIMYLDKIIWLIFFVDVLIRFVMAKRKWQFVKENPFDIIAAIPLDSIFQTARIVRLFRVLRFFSIGKKYLTPIRNILATNGLGRLLAVSAGILIVATFLVTYFEPDIHSYSDGLYWAVVTTTTVGYGDLSPVTGVGRIIAIVLMLVGIGIIGMLTGSLTTYFVKDQKENNPTIDFIQSELDRYEELTQAEKKRLEMLLEGLNKE